MELDEQASSGRPPPAGHLWQIAEAVGAECSAYKEADAALREE